jgi:carbonic anhydrase/acetyltransferase-like protein (isoleucine patch superfamily)/nitrate reductase NapE component
MHNPMFSFSRRYRFRLEPALLALLLALVPIMATAQEEQSSPRGPAARVHSDRGDVTVIGDRTVEEGETAKDLVVAGGNLRVRGAVEGDVVVIGGNLILEESGMISGDAVVAGGEIIDHGGRIAGEMRVVEDISGLAGVGGAATAKSRRELNKEIAAEVRKAKRDHAETRVRHERSWFDPIREGLAGVISTLALGLVLAGIGATLIFYGRPYLETVSDTIRSSTLRAGAVGLAAGFLAIPGFVVLIVALAVSIVGIPLLLLVVPLYPLAIAAALAFGLLAAAHALGERTAEQRTPLDLGYRNSYSYLFTGLAMLLAPLLAAHLIGMTGFLGWIATLLKICAGAVIWIAATAGLGAVILSRAGTRRTFVTPLRDEPTDPDPLFDSEPLR